ncbi:MAG: transketolase [Candidatus Woesebacteria bacterium]|jgi:transketolase
MQTDSIKNLDIDKLKSIAKQIRIDIIKMLAEVGSGHPASALGTTDIFTSLYFYILNHNSKNPSWAGRDYFLLSNGHICPVLYATLARAGYFSLDELKTLRQLNSRLQGHPHFGSLPGVENTSGSLGQGLSLAAGLAYALKLDQKQNYVYCSLSDAETQEGQTLEALMFAHKYKLDNLIAFIDRNKIQIEGPTSKIMPLEPYAAKFKSFGWRVFETNGHNFIDIIETFHQAKQIKNMASLIIFNTVAGKGVDFMEKDHRWHGKVPNQEETKLAIEQLAAF